MNQEHLQHLKKFIESSFVSVAFDETMRQMDKNSVSSSFINKRINEVFNNLLFQERNIYKNILQTNLNDLKSDKKDLDQEIEEKSARIDKYIKEALAENAEIRAAVMKERLQEDMKKQMEDISIDKNQSKINFLNKQISSIKQPAQAIKQRNIELQNEIAAIAGQNSLFIRKTKEDFRIIRDKKDQQYIEFKKLNLNSEKINKYDDILKNEKEKTRKMKEIVARTLNFVTSMSGNNEEITTENYSEKKFQFAVKTLLRKESEASKKETYKLLNCGEQRINEVLEVIARQIEDGVSQAKRKYEKALNSQQERMNNLHKQLKNARNKISKLETGRLNTSNLLKEMEDVSNTIRTQSNRTDNALYEVENYLQSYS